MERKENQIPSQAPTLCENFRLVTRNSNFLRMRRAHHNSAMAVL